jgi:dephospho-CoA kinase
MKIIGLLGGVASGKSMVAEQLASCGAAVLNADKIAHEVLQQPNIVTAVRECWGNAVFSADGRIDRSRLAEIVFAPSPEGAKNRTCLERLTHPEIIRIMREQLDVLAQTAVKAVVLDAPLLQEAGLDELCDKLIFVDARPEVRLQRAISRGWRKEDFTAREGAQESLDFKRMHADVVIDNSGSPEQTQTQVKRLWQTLIR